MLARQDTPPKFNIAPDGLKITFRLGWLIFRGYVKLPGGSMVVSQTCWTQLERCSMHMHASSFQVCLGMQIGNAEAVVLTQHGVCGFVQCQISFFLISLIRLPFASTKQPLSGHTPFSATS